MAYTESADIVSFPSGTTFGSTSLYKFAFINGSGQVIATAPTTNAFAIGSLYGITSTTNAGQAVPVAMSGVVKVQMAASTQAAGDFVAASSAGLGVVGTTDSYIAGQIVSGSSGSAGRIVSVILHSGPAKAGL